MATVPKAVATPADPVKVVKPELSRPAHVNSEVVGDVTVHSKLLISVMPSTSVMVATWPTNKVLVAVMTAEAALLMPVKPVKGVGATKVLKPAELMARAVFAVSRKAFLGTN